MFGFELSININRLPFVCHVTNWEYRNMKLQGAWQTVLDKNFGYVDHGLLLKRSTPVFQSIFYGSSPERPSDSRLKTRKVRYICRLSFCRTSPISWRWFLRVDIVDWRSLADNIHLQFHWLLHRLPEWQLVLQDTHFILYTLLFSYFDMIKIITRSTADEPNPSDSLCAVTTRIQFY